MKDKLSSFVQLSCQISIYLAILFSYIGCSDASEDSPSYFAPPDCKHIYRYTYQSQIDDRIEIWDLSCHGNKIIARLVDEESTVYQQVHYSEITGGVVMDSIFLFAEGGFLKAKVLFDDIYLDSPPDSMTAWVNKIRFDQGDSHYIITKNRRRVGEGLFSFKGKNYESVTIKVNELFEHYKEGTISQKMTAIEKYALGLGLVYRKKTGPDGVMDEFLLISVERM